MASPASSPRLPSPPPMAEDQVSPSAGLDSEFGKLGHEDSMDKGASRRIRPGTKAEDMQEGPPLIDLQSIDSAFQLTEHLKALHNSHTQSCTVAMDKATAQELAQPPPGVERGIWLYELCRFLTQKANMMAIALFADDPACSAHTCPEMRASEWQYLCAAHEPPKSCCAIDYCCHTLDWCATALTSTKLFPSRLNLGTESASAAVQIRKMTEVFRRVYRIFAHAWFSHRDVFWRVESKTGLYLLFKTVCDEYRLIPEDNYTIPPEAEGIDDIPTTPSISTPTILQRDGADNEPARNTTVATGNTTKRHRHTMSDRAASVSTIIHEEVEEEEDDRPTTSMSSMAPALFRVETVIHDEPLAVQEQEQEQDIPTGDPPPYTEEPSIEKPEKSESAEPGTASEKDIEAEAEPAQEVAAEHDNHDQETDEHADTTTTSNENASAAEPTTESSEDTVPSSTGEEAAAADVAEEPEAEQEQEINQEEKETTKEEEEESRTAEGKSSEEEEKDISKPMDPVESGAADESEASKTVAD